MKNALAKLSPTQRTSLLLVCVVLAVLGVVLAEHYWLSQAGSTQPAIVGGRSEDIRLLPIPAAQPMEATYPEMVARPLFIHSRRPSPPAATVVATMQRGKYQLLGTSLTKEFGDTAFLKDVATNKVQAVRKGAQLGAATLDVVALDRVTLKQGDEMEEILIRVQPSPKAPAAVAQAAPPANLLGAQPPQNAGPQPGKAAQPTPPPTGNPASGIGFGPQPSPAGSQGPTGLPVPAAGRPEAATAPPTPEEIMARRRAARAQQTQ